jgi:hypothetical protein
VNALDDGGLKQGKPQQCVGPTPHDITATADHAVVEHLLPIKSPLQRYQQGWVYLVVHPAFGVSTRPYGRITTLLAQRKKDMQGPGGAMTGEPLKV